MFLHLLSTPQKESFFVLAYRLSMIDAEQDRSELRRLEDLKRRLGQLDDPDMAAIAAELDVSAFDTTQSRSIAMMELLSLAYSDDFLDQAESDMISDIAVAFGFTQEDLNKMAEWAMSSLELINRGEAMMNG